MGWEVDPGPQLRGELWPRGRAEEGPAQREGGGRGVVTQAGPGEGDRLHVLLLDSYDHDFITNSHHFAEAENSLRGHCQMSAFGFSDLSDVVMSSWHILFQFILK